MSSPWEVKLRFKSVIHKPGYPDLAVIRILVTAPADPSDVKFTADVPATATGFTFPCGEGTQLPAGDYSLRLIGLSADGAVSNEHSIFLRIDPPRPLPPMLDFSEGMPATTLVVPPDPPPAA